MPPTETSLDYKIGQLTGQIGALIDSNKSLADSMRRIEEKFEDALKGLENRIDENREDTLGLKIKMSLFGTLGGLVGGAAVTVVAKLLFKV